MKKRIALVLVLVFAFSLILTSCGKKKDSEDTTPTIPYKTVYESEENEAFSKAELKSELTGMQLKHTYGALLLYENSDAAAGKLKNAVLDTETGNIVFTLKKEANAAKVTSVIQILTYSSVTFIEIIKTDLTDEENPVYTRTLYTDAGKEIASKKFDSIFDAIPVRYIGRLDIGDESVFVVSVDEKIYNVTDGVATFVKDEGLTALSSNIVDEIDFVNDKHYFAVDGDELIVYDHMYNLVGYYSVPYECDINGYGLLSNGNFFIQYIKYLPDSDTEYDLYADGEKIDVVSIIYNVSDATTREIDLDCIVDTVNCDPAILGDIFVEGAVDNVAIIVPIADKRMNDNNIEFVNCNSDMQILGRLGKEVPGQEYIPILIANNRFMVENKAGQTLLLNEKLEVIGDVSGADFDYDTGIFEKGDKYYDTDLNLVFDKGEITYELYRNMAYCDLYRDEKTVDGDTVYTYYLLNGVTMKKLDLPKGATFSDYGADYFSYVYTTGDGSDAKTYKAYCNVEGDVIYTVETGAENFYGINVSQSNSVLIFTLITKDADGNYEYQYYVAK